MKKHLSLLTLLAVVSGLGAALITSLPSPLLESVSAQVVSTFEYQVAQQSGSDEEIEEIVTTGSRIRRSNDESLGSIDTILASQFSDIQLDTSSIPKNEVPEGVRQYQLGSNLRLDAGAILSLDKRYLEIRGLDIVGVDSWLGSTPIETSFQDYDDRLDLKFGVAATIGGNRWLGLDLKYKVFDTSDLGTLQYRFETSGEANLVTQVPIELSELYLPNMYLLDSIPDIGSSIPEILEAYTSSFNYLMIKGNTALSFTEEQPSDEERGVINFQYIPSPEELDSFKAESEKNEQGYQVLPFFVVKDDQTKEIDEIQKKIDELQAYIDSNPDTERASLQTDSGLTSLELYKISMESFKGAINKADVNILGEDLQAAIDDNTNSYSLYATMIKDNKKDEAFLEQRSELVRAYLGQFGWDVYDMGAKFSKIEASIQYLSKTKKDDDVEGDIDSAADDIESAGSGSRPFTNVEVGAREVRASGNQDLGTVLYQDAQAIIRRINAGGVVQEGAFAQFFADVFVKPILEGGSQPRQQTSSSSSDEGSIEDQTDQEQTTAKACYDRCMNAKALCIQCDPPSDENQRFESCEEINSENIFDLKNQCREACDYRGIDSVIDDIEGALVIA